MQTDVASETWLSPMHGRQRLRARKDHVLCKTGAAGDGNRERPPKNQEVAATLHSYPPSNVEDGLTPLLSPLDLSTEQRKNAACEGENVHGQQVSH